MDRLRNGLSDRGVDRACARLWCVVAALCCACGNAADVEPEAAGSAAPVSGAGGSAGVSSPAAGGGGMAGTAAAAGGGGTAGSANVDDAGDLPQDAGLTSDAAPPTHCNLTGSWVEQHNTSNTALGAQQISTNWSFLRIEQQGTQLRVVANLDCGYAVRGSTDVSLADATLEAMALLASNGIGTTGSFAPSADGNACELQLHRIYAIRGANKAKFLDAIWKVGDADKALSEFSMPTNASEGMEDWDNDAHEALTQQTGLGDRYCAQIDWFALSGTLALDAGSGTAAIGSASGPNKIDAAYDARESVSQETSLLLRTSSVPMSPGYARLVRADDVEVTTGDHQALRTCKNVQARAVQVFGDPPRP